MAIVIGGGAVLTWEAIVAIGAVVGIVGAGGYVATHPEQTREAAESVGAGMRKVNDAVERGVISIAKATVCQDCKNKNEKCPVCGRLPNPTPGQVPAYVTAVPPRAPMDYETNPPMGTYRRTKEIRNGRRVYERPDGTQVYVDSFHKGAASEIECFSPGGKHLGEICPQCGSMRPNSADAGKTLK